MKKTIILAAIASVALASCVKNEVLSPTAQNGVQEPITFTAMATPATKAAQPGEIGTSYNTAEKFTVFAAWTDAAYPGSSSTNPPTVFMAGADAKDRCTYDATLVAWKPAVTYYWPKTGYLTFAAFSPSDAKDDCTSAPSYVWAYSGTGGLTIPGFTVQANIEDQYDLMYADREYNKVKGDYSITDGSAKDDENDTAQSDGYTYAYNGVNLRFHHALSSIVFKVKTADDYTTATIKLTSIVLQNVYSKATFNETITEGASYYAVPAWSSYDAKVNYDIYDDTGDPATNQVVAYNSGTAQVVTLAGGSSAVILLPQDLTASTAPNLHIEYTIEQNGGAPVPQTADIVLHNYNHGTGDAQRKWVMGKRYTYTIVFGLNEIYFDPAVEAWVDQAVTGDLEVI